MSRTLAAPSAPRRLGLLASAGAGLALVVAACGGATATPVPTPSSDAYSVVSKAVAAPMDHVKVNVGLKTTGGTSDVTIDPKQIEVVADTKAGKGTLHLSIPKAVLGTNANALPLAGDTIDVDVLFDGNGLYIKSPLAATLLPLLFMQSGQQVPGDLSGWIKLGTAEELGGLLGGLGALPDASAHPSATGLSGMTPEELKQQLQDAGITVTVVGSESRNGVESDHVTITVDPTKLADSDIAKEIPGGQLGQIQDLAGKGTLSGDLWFERATGRLNEADINVADKNGESATITVLLTDPGNVSIDAPAGATEVPIAPLLQMLMQSFGGLMSPAP